MTRLPVVRVNWGRFLFGKKSAKDQTFNAQPIVERTCWVRMCREFNNAIKG